MRPPRTAVSLAALLLIGASLSTVSSARPHNQDLAHGRELVVTICSSCHTLTRISMQHLSKDEWRGEIKGMLSEGAAVTAEETELIVQYLGKNFGPLQEKP